MAENNQKIKLLKLWEMLCADSDEDNPLTVEDIIERLARENISCNSKQVLYDVQCLNEYGYEVMSRNVGHKKGYYVEDRSFNISEIKILLDAVQASRFITRKKTEALTDKIAALGSSQKAEILKQDIVKFNTNKHSNEHIYYTVDALEQAISTGKKASFRYFDINEKNERVYRKRSNGSELYIVDPIALLYSDENYYLTGFTEGHLDKPTNYRLDRMTDTLCLNEDIDNQTEEYLKNRDISRDATQLFGMYSGQPKNVRLKFSRDMIGPVYDHFGEQTKISSLSGDYYRADVMVQESYPFFAWVFSMGGKMQILSPETMRNTYKEYLLAAYNGADPDLEGKAK